ncbi:MAG: hypothetical protein V7727_19195 [Sneathiella sp.]
MSASYLDCVQTIILAVWNFLNGNFITALAGALAGAFFGAWAAQKIAKSNHKSEQLLDEIRNTNSAITLSFSIFSSFFSLKEQIINPLVEDYVDTRSRYEEHMEKLSRGASALPDEVGVARMVDVAIPPVPTK